jgi:thiamine biosynthesis protein ThiI
MIEDSVQQIYTMDGEDREEVVMVRYGELFLKSEPVKRRFLEVLAENIRTGLEAEGIVHWLEIPRGRIFIHGKEPERIAWITSRIFGIVDTGICTRTKPTPEALSTEAIRQAIRSLYPGMTFAVRARREQKVGLASPELAARIGSAILEQVPEARVDLDHPQYEVLVEVRETGGYVCDKRTPAPGGLPLGTQGLVVSLLSAGIDSPVAAWLMMKRGCVPLFLHMNSGRWSGTNVQSGSIENFRRLSSWSLGQPLTLHIVSSERFFDRMEEFQIPPRFRCVLCKRWMLRAGSHLAREAGAYALVSGENLGQVASQTLANMSVISSASHVPVLRPLITYDKGEIVALAKKIGTFGGPTGDLSCRAVPVHPSTAAPRGKIDEIERNLGIEKIVQEALLEKTTVTALNGKIQEMEPG